MKTLMVVFLLLLSAQASAQEKDPLAWSPKARPIANALSNVTLGAEIALDSWHSWKAPDRKRAFLGQLCAIGVSQAAANVTKLIVHRSRPDGSDEKSFFSGHTATAFASSGWNYSIGIPLAVGTGFLRMSAAKHYATDVAVGAGVGLLSQWVCK